MIQQLLSHSADEWTAWWTFMLTIVTGVAAFFAYRAYRISLSAFQAETAAALVVTKPPPSQPFDETASRFVLARNKDGAVVVREREFSDSPMSRNYSGVNPHYGGAPDWPRIALVVRNVGRSSAVDVTLGVDVYMKRAMSALRNTQPDGYNGPWEAGMDYAYDVTDAEDDSTIRGELQIDVIEPGQNAKVYLENRFNAKIKVWPQSAFSVVMSPFGRQRGQELSVIAIGAPFER